MFLEVVELRSPGRKGRPVSGLLAGAFRSTPLSRRALANCVGMATMTLPGRYRNHPSARQDSGA